MGLITNGLESVQKARLKHFNLYQYFEVILISGECGLAKPDPAIFQLSLELLNHDRKESVLMIGDSLSSDIAGANNFGIDSCWFNPNRLKLQSGKAPTFTVYSLEEIADFLGTGLHPIMFLIVYSVSSAEVKSIPAIPLSTFYVVMRSSIKRKACCVPNFQSICRSFIRFSYPTVRNQRQSNDLV